MPQQAIADILETNEKKKKLQQRNRKSQERNKRPKEEPKNQMEILEMKNIITERKQWLDS